jgi:pimeloyl-ACP methyl ester carboxylesterase
VTEAQKAAGYFRSGLPYNRFGHGPQILVVFQGLAFENKPRRGVEAWYLRNMYRFLEPTYTTYAVTRKPGLPAGYSMQNMADDYAVTIREEFGEAIDVIGTSTGGSIAQPFAADHPGLVRRLVLYASAYTLGDTAKELQLRVGHLARQGNWRAASRALLDFAMPPTLPGQMTAAIASLMISLTAPDDPSDLIVTVEAEDKHNFRDRLGEITAPTLVITGTQDPFYTEALLRETAAGIPNARLILYEGKGHAPTGPQFDRDVLAFLTEDWPSDA